MTVAHEPHKSSPRPATGLNVIQALKARDLSAADLAKYLTIHRSYMSRMLNGINPIESFLPRISEFLSVTVEQLEKGGKSLKLEETSVLPFGPLDEDGRGKVPDGCIILRVTKYIDAHRSVGSYVLLAPPTQEPKANDLVYCATTAGDRYIRTYIPNPGNPSLFMLSPNAASDSIVAMSRDKKFCDELRVVAVRNLFPHTTKE